MLMIYAIDLNIALDMDGPRTRLFHAQTLGIAHRQPRARAVRQLFTMAKAAVTGKPPNNISESGEVRMR
jgi:hypothetical protein